MKSQNDLLDEIKFNDADDYCVNDICLEEVDEKCPYCNKYMRIQAEIFVGQRDLVIECVSCPEKYMKVI